MDVLVVRSLSTTLLSEPRSTQFITHLTSLSWSTEPSQQNLNQNLAGLSPAALNPEDKVVVRAVVVPGRLTTCVNAASDRHGRRIGQDNRDIANDTVAVRESVLESLTPEAQEQGDAASGGLLEPEIDVIGLAAAGVFLDFVFTEA